MPHHQEFCVVSPVPLGGVVSLPAPLLSPTFFAGIVVETIDSSNRVLPNIHQLKKTPTNSGLREIVLKSQPVHAILNIFRMGTTRQCRTAVLKQAYAKVRVRKILIGVAMTFHLLVSTLLCPHDIWAYA